MFLIGFFSKRKKFSIVEQRETMDEVEAYLRNHDYGHFQKLVVFGQVSHPTKHAPDAATTTHACNFSNSLYCSTCGKSQF